MKKILNLKSITIITIILFFVLIYFFINSFKIFKIGEVQAAYEAEDIPEIQKNFNPINLKKVLQENTNHNIKEEMSYEEIDIEYTTQYIDNEDLPSGTIHVSQIGIDGKQNVITIKRYEDENLISEQIVAKNITKAEINKVVEIGTGRGKNNYELKVGDIVYSTPSSLPIMSDQSNSSEKLYTISKGTEVNVLEIFENGWSYIIAEDRNGYVLSEGLSNINPLEIKNIETNGKELSKSELLAKLNENMDVGIPSGFSLEQFRKILQYNEADKNNIFTDNADYFYYAEQEYGINGVFLASIAIHESGWGTSSIATNKKNLFGYMAYDSSPYMSSAEFSSYSEGIDLLARVLIKYYLNPAGSTIYAGNVAEGKYYEGTTIKSVNKHYATDSNWSKSVYGIMKKLYNSL